MHAYLERWWQEIVRLDGKFWATFRTLVRSPGALSAAYFEPLEREGHRPLVHPVRLYLTVNIVFFFLAPWLNSNHISVWRMDHRAVAELHPPLGEMLQRTIDGSGIEESLYRQIFDQRMVANQGALVFLLIPVLAVAAFAVCRRRRRYLVEHLVLATHLISFFVISVLTLGIVGRLIFALSPSDPIAPVTMRAMSLATFAWLIWLPWTGYRSIKTFYALTRRRYAAALTLWLAVAFVVGLILYLDALFLTTYYGLRDLSLPIGG